MKPDQFASLAGRLMRQPAAPYHEAGVRAEAERICAENRIPFRRDKFGNLWVGALKGRKERTLVLAAHLDHPAFVLRLRREATMEARFLGGVGESYFKRGLQVRVHPGGARAILDRKLAPKTYTLSFRDKRATGKQGDASAGQFAVWDLPDFVYHRDRISGRACDDLIGVAVTLAVLIALRGRRAAPSVIGILARAEEVGFQGALLAAESPWLPRKALVVSLETSKEIPPIKMGQGTIIRVGDRTSIFDTRATRFLTETATALQRRQPAFQFQRALMSGGTCEATAYQEYGCQTAALCVALGNYHNCAAGNRIGAEYIDVRDACGMVDLLVAAAKNLPRYDRLIGRLPQQLAQLQREARRRLISG